MENREREGIVELNQEEILRYSRHLIMPEVALEGQQRLKAASVLIIGAGGLGSPLGLYLAAAGVGRIGLVDFDVVDFTNLQRQVLYATDDVGRSKLQCAQERLRSLNPAIEVNPYPVRLTSENALELFASYDVIVDGTDNFPTRYLVNDACVLLGKPNVYGSIFRFEGQALGEEWEISPPDLQERLEGRERPFLLDVREPQEYQICRLDGATLIPLSQLPARLHELDSAEEIVVYCKTGGRSRKALELLQQSGFRHLRNLTGGINAWSLQVDPSVSRY